MNAQKFSQKALKIFPERYIEAILEHGAWPTSAAYDPFQK